DGPGQGHPRSHQEVKRRRHPKKVQARLSSVAKTPGERSRRRPPVGAILIAAAALVGGGIYFAGRGPGKSGAKKAGRLNVLLVTLDTTRADRLGCYGYLGGKTPNLDALAAAGVLFQNVYAQVPLTLPSHCSIMTGTTPLSHGIHNNGGYVLSPERTTLAEMLKARGFRTAAFVASFSVDSRFGLDQGFDLYDDSFQAGLPFKPVNSERRADTVAALFSAWLDGQDGEPFFAWVHFFDPHLPYRPPAPYDREFSSNPYDGEIAFMDEAVGTVVGKLREKNLLERTLVVLAGDHGEAFGEKVETGHGVFLYEETLKVPLILHASGRLAEGKVVSSRVRLTDIVPTVLDMVGLPVPAEVEGQSLLPLASGKKEKGRETYIETFYPRENYGWSELVGLISGDWKYIRAPKSELYNLRTDPAETRNEAGSSGETVAGLDRKLEDLVRKSGGLAAGPSRPLKAEEQERLRSLGYVNFSGGGAASSAADPKDKLDVLKLAQIAEGFELEGRYAEAKDAYTRLLELVPDSPASYVNLSLSEARLKEFDEAIVTLRLGTERMPDSAVLHVRLGHTYLVTGRPAEALVSMDRVIALEPRNVDAYTAAASALDALGRKAEARDYLEKAIAVEPENIFLRMSLAMNLASTGDLARAIEVYKALVADNPVDHVLRQHLGVAYGVAGDYASSVESFKQAIAIIPTPTAYLNLAVALKKSGDVPAAVESLRLYLADPKGESPASVKAAEAELRALEASLKK
ncbi:MAG: sulfatase-like hydrolase/transferase, partial [Candidatus Aminicenantes bacterium]|nr:sulfatase-like hydrolase/transferase [Candidatus Aminicenantes bacterium]